MLTLAARRVTPALLTLLASLPIQAGTVLVSTDQLGAGHPAVKTVTYFGQLINQRTQGNLSVSVKPDGAGGTDVDTLRLVAEGKQAMTRVNLGVVDKIPSVHLLSLPYLFRSNSHLRNVLKGDMGARVDAELASAGYVRLMYLETDARNFFCKKPLRTAEDFRGLKIRVLPSKVFDELIANLGGESVSVPFSKIGEALKKGEVDCAESGLINYTTSDYDKIAPYMMQDEHMLIPDVILFSKKIWDGLPPAEQDILRKAADESMEYMSKIWQETLTAATAKAKKDGATIIPRSQIAMTGIESQAIKLYNSYIKDGKDLETVMRIVTAR